MGFPEASLIAAELIELMGKEEESSQNQDARKREDEKGLGHRLAQAFLLQSRSTFTSWI